MDEVETFGGILMKGLLGNVHTSKSNGVREGLEDLSCCDLRASTRASGILALLLVDNTTAKERCLRTPIEIRDNCSVMLMPKLISYMQDAPLESIYRHDPNDVLSSPLYVQITMLKVLSIWLHDCSKAVGHFLSNDLHLPMIVDMVIHAPSVMNRNGGMHSSEEERGSSADVISLLQGLAAVVVGMCLVYGEDMNDSSNNFKMMKALDVMSSRIGISRFFKKFEMLFNSGTSQKAISDPTEWKITSFSR